MPGDAPLRIGTSGYVFPHWRRGVFYPEGLPAREELGWYAGRFSTVELNNPFYRVPTPATITRWREATPDGFMFAVKLNREVSHVRRLREVADPLRDFLAIVGGLGAKLGPLLVQLPPQLVLDTGTLDRFLAQLPGERQWVLEARHPSWQTAEVYRRLAACGVALCVPIGGRLPPDLVTTAPFTYLRFHAGRGPEGRFPHAQLVEWAGRIRGLRRSGKGVYAYFNNDREGRAAQDAALLRSLLEEERRALTPPTPAL
jgi:uncharacterized protein YecE (DUF72 family)